MRYAQIRSMDVTDGDGIRVALYTQGCRLHCKNCYNYEIWDFNGGQAWSTDVQNTLFTLCDKPYISGLSILGGEPLSPENLADLAELFNAFHKRFPEKNIWMWTGYVYENLTDEQKAVADLVDVLVDGPFVDELKDLSLKFRGSSNQRILRKVNGQFQEE